MEPLTTQYTSHSSAAFQFRAAVRRRRHVTRSEIAPSCFIITDEAIISRATQTAPVTKLAVVRGARVSASGAVYFEGDTVDRWSAPCSGLVTATRARHSASMHEASKSPRSCCRCPRAARMRLHLLAWARQRADACCTWGEGRNERNRKSQWWAVWAGNLLSINVQL